MAPWTYGGRLNAAAGAGDDARYTDHEYDGALDLNYMKGRCQQAAAAKFNRPRPRARLGLDQTLHPQPISIHQQ